MEFIQRKPLFQKGNADLLSELPTVIKQFFNDTVHHSMKMTAIQASKKSNEKLVYPNLEDDRKIETSKSKSGELVRTADIERVFSKGDSTN